jgi:acetyl-CoA acetyltransferase
MQHAGVSPRWLDHIPMGGASGVVALRRAARAIQAGDAELIACIGADTNHVDTFRDTIASFSQFANDAVYPYGSGGPNSSFAFLTDYYMREFGVSREDFGKLCIAQRDNALPVAHAMMKKPLTMEQYLNARLIADPIRLFDCVMPCAGAEAFLVMSDERAQSLNIPYTTILSTIERHNAFPDDPVQFRGGWALDVDEFYSQAGIGPEDINFLQAYDDYPVICFMQIEDLGFCKKGEVSNFLSDKDLTVNGNFPVNTSGGQLSVGQAGAGGGYLGVVETIRQLTLQTQGHQVEKAKHGLVSCFGMINYDRGLCTSAAILTRG